MRHYGDGRRLASLRIGPSIGLNTSVEEGSNEMVPPRKERAAPLIYAIARMTIPFKKLNEAIEILSSVMQRTRFKSGCISCNVYRNVDSENAVMIEEIWNDERDLMLHLRSEEYQKILLVAEMASAPPEIRFDTIERTTGVETVEKARTGGEEEKIH
jgi:quinol monooxygenase YgiN